MFKNRPSFRFAVVATVLIALAAITATATRGTQFAFIDSVQEFFGMALVTTPTITARPEVTIDEPLTPSAAISITTLGTAYTQNSNTLSDIAGSTANNPTIPGRDMAETGGGTRDNEQSAVYTGASTAGNAHTFGAGERRRLGLIHANIAERTDFQYRLNGADLVTGTWVDVNALNFNPPITPRTLSALYQNAAANRTALASTISGLSIPNGATFWNRWTSIDAASSDDGLATDDLSITTNAAAVPTLGTYANTAIGLSGNTTVTPSVPPTGTTSINVSAPTSFIGKLTADPATGVVRVTNAALAKIPAGAYPITVRAFGPGGAATATFDLTITTRGCTGVPAFTATPDVGVGNSPVSVAVGDFNGDGIQDLAVTNEGAVAIRLGNGSGGFTGASEVPLDYFSYSVAVADFNGDGIQDIAAAVPVPFNTVSIRLGDGMGGFSGTTEVPVGDDPRSVAVGDFNGDGKTDIAVANTFSSTISIRLGDGMGGFAGSADVPVPLFPRALVVGDFNGDGNHDIAAVIQGSFRVSILLGDGIGGFSSTAEVLVGSGPISLSLGDFNRDGIQDIVTANSNAATVSVRLGDGMGGFSGTTEIPTGGVPYYAAVGDLNGDGKQDLAIAKAGALMIRTGDGMGGFSGTTDVPVTGIPTAIAVGDFNGDGRQDLAANDEVGNSASLRLGTCTSPPTVTTVAASLVMSTNATLNGTANPNGEATTGHFRYSTTSPGTCNDSFGTRAPVLAASDPALGAGNLAVPFGENITGLIPSTTYYYCAIASNTGGTAFGTVQSFTTVGGTEIQFSAAQYIEDESQTAVVTLTRSGDLSGTSSVSFNATPAGGAVAGATCTGTVDYAVQGTPLPRSVSFGANEATKTVLFDICSDTVTDPGESINMALYLPSGATLGTQTTAVLNINDTASRFLSVIPHEPIGMTLGSAANPYPSQIVVSGAPNIIGGMRVTLFDIWHDNPDNIDVLLVGPQGQKYVLMGDVGGPFVIAQGAPVTLTFSDIATAALSDSSMLMTGVFLPTTCETPVSNFFGPAPMGPYVEPGCAVSRPQAKTLFGTPPTGFGLTNPNGTWKLFVRDDNGSLRPIVAKQTTVGAIGGGWGLEFLAPTAADVSIGGRVLTAGGRGIRGAFVTVTGNSLVSPINVMTGVNGRYTVPGLTAGETYVVTVRSRRFFFDQPSRIITLNDNVTDADFTGSTGSGREQ